MIRRCAARLGWALMGLPVGIREPNMWLLRYGPYHWGAKLCAWGSQ